MTDLQLGLLLLGVVVVIGVVVYNRLQEHAVRRETQRTFASQHSDVLLENEPAHAAVAQAFASPRAQAPVDALPDERVDYVILLRVPTGIPGAAALEPWRALEQRFPRRVLLAGSDGTGWKRIAQGDFGSFNALRAALQLVSRGGVVGDAELVEFRAGVETLAASIRAEVAAPEMRQALNAAHELDRLCADTDIQVALHVVGALDAAATDQALEGIVEAPYQALRREDGITLLLDMPRTLEVSRAYEAMTRMALHLAATLGGRIVDDRGNELGQGALAAIESQLESVRGQLSAAGIEPGSPLALRLFS